ncbi:MAG: DUF934 domain-containing protein [Alphaproteobacteria bacterium]|tara:strand:+ start:116 stop:565 length:450 start_codon:yes stop_codon:yes gene_type:complete
MVVLKKGKIYKNEYFFINDIELIYKPNIEKPLFDSNVWKECKELVKNKKAIGIKISSDQEIEFLRNDINYFNLIQFEFLSFKDGRPFTLAKKLRQEFNYVKEIRASGNILPDQYIFLKRSGFDSVEIEESSKDTWINFYNMDDGLYYQP